MEKPVVLLFCVLCIVTVFLAGCAGYGAMSGDPAVGTYGDPTRNMVDAVTITLNGDGTYAWKFPLYTVNGRWERVDATTIRLEGKVESSAGAISVPKTATFDPEKKTLQVGSTTYKMGVIGKKWRVVAFTAENNGDGKAVHEISVVCQGGQDVADMTKYVIEIDGKSAQEVSGNTIGTKTQIPNIAAGAHRVEVTAQFNDGTEQTMLDTRI